MYESSDACTITFTMGHLFYITITLLFRPILNFADNTPELVLGI